MFWPPINADERRLKTRSSSVLIRVHRRPILDAPIRQQTSGMVFTQRPPRIVGNRRCHTDCRGAERGRRAGADSPEFERAHRAVLAIPRPESSLGNGCGGGDPRITQFHMTTLRALTQIIARAA